MNLSEYPDDIEVIYMNDEDAQALEFDQEIMEFPPPDLSKLTFTKHTNHVLSCDLSKDGKLAVTGGQDDRAYVWQTNDGEIVFECTGHKDSVTEAKFNFDCQLIATGDMGGLVQVWNVNEKKLIWCNEGDDIHWLIWHHSANVILSGTKTGYVFMWSIPQGACKVMPSPGSDSISGKLLNDGKRCAVGYENGIIKLWDLKSSTTTMEFKENIISFIEVNGNNTLLASAPDGYIYKLTDGKIISDLNIYDPIESIVFNDELNLLIVGDTGGILYIWDISKFVMRYSLNLESFITFLSWKSNEKVIASTTSGKLYICDIRQGNVVTTLTGHDGVVTGIKTSEDKSFILSVSEDWSAKIFSLENL